MEVPKNVSKEEQQAFNLFVAHWTENPPNTGTMQRDLVGGTYFRIDTVGKKFHPILKWRDVILPDYGDNNYFDTIDEAKGELWIRYRGKLLSTTIAEETSRKPSADAETESQ